ncbi:MAG TPA: hypothetical protein DCP92_22330 [Nitrospiraceae bacterium]|nr:hypothetical protein [Nitrospiraceae bacterium]
MTAARASEMRRIELTDGTVITGEIVSLSNGVYTVKSASLGTIQIQESKILTIGAKGSLGSSGTAGDQVKSLQEKMIGDSEVMSLIQALQNDKDLQEILRDPEIMKAVQAGDISALAANPKFMKLLNKQTIQQIKNKVSQ